MKRDIIPIRRRSPLPVVLAAALVFLWLNELRLEADDDALTDLVYGIAEGRLGKADAAVFLAAGLSRRR